MTTRGNRHVSIRLTPHQRALLARGVEVSGTETLSEYVRNAALVRAAEDTGVDPPAVVGTGSEVDDG